MRLRLRWAKKKPWKLHHCKCFPFFFRLIAQPTENKTHYIYFLHIQKSYVIFKNLQISDDLNTIRTFPTERTPFIKQKKVRSQDANKTPTMCSWTEPGCSIPSERLRTLYLKRSKIKFYHNFRSLQQFKIRTFKLWRNQDPIKIWHCQLKLRKKNNRI